MKKKELIDRVVALSKAKKKDVKSIVEATLSVLGDALSQGDELNLPPFGKARVNRQRDLSSGEMMIVRLRRGGAGDAAAPGRNGAKDTLAEADD